MKKIILILCILFLVVGCNKMAPEEMQEKAMESMKAIEAEEMEDFGMYDWQEFELKNVHDGTKFKMSDFRGKPILLESFAVWCPTCTKQQEELKALHKELGDSVIIISLNTDPNEDEDAVKAYVEENGFDWRYAVSPIEMTRALIDAFGVNVVNAPSAPIVLVCEDFDSRALPWRLKNVDELKEEIAKGCIP